MFIVVIDVNVNLEMLAECIDLSSDVETWITGNTFLNDLGLGTLCDSIEVNEVLLSMLESLLLVVNFIVPEESIGSKHTHVIILGINMDILSLDEDL